MALLILLSASAPARIIRIDLLLLSLLRRALLGLVTVGSGHLRDLLTFDLLLHLYMVHHPQRVFLDGTGHGIEHVIAFHLIHNLRILLPVCGKADALTQLVHIVNMVHPVTVHGTKQEYTLDLTHIHAGIRKLRLFLLIQRKRIRGQLLLQRGRIQLAHILLCDRGDGDDGADVIIQFPEVPSVGIILTRGSHVHIGADRVADHAHNGFAHVLSIENLAPLSVYDLPLFVVDLVVFQQVLSDREVVRLDLLLRAFDGGGKHLMLDPLALLHAQRLEGRHHLLRAEQAHQVILQGNVKLGFTRVSLTAGTSAQLVVNTP